MARTTLNKTAILGPYPTLQPAADSLDLNLQACSGSAGANGNQFAWGDFKELIVTVQNSHASIAYTFTISSVAVAPYNRTGDITAYSLAAGEVAQFRLAREGWINTDGMLYCEGSNAAVKFAAAGIN